MEGGYFRIDGADLETGEESYLVLQAASVSEAESVARKQGLLIAAVRAASSSDWGASQDGTTPERPGRPTEVIITFEPRRPAAQSSKPVSSVMASSVVSAGPALQDELFSQPSDGVATIDLTDSAPIKIVEPASAVNMRVMEPIATATVDPQGALSASQPADELTLTASIAPEVSSSPVEIGGEATPASATPPSLTAATTPQIAVSDAKADPARPITSLFGEVLLSPDVASWVAARPADDQVVVANTNSAASPAVVVVSAAPATLPTELADIIGNAPTAPVAEPAPVESVVPKALADVEPALAAVGAVVESFSEGIVSANSFDPAGPGAVSFATPSTELLSPPKPVAVKAKPVVISRVGLPAPLRRNGPSPSSGNGPASRIGPGGSFPPVPDKPAARAADPVIVQTNGGDAPGNGSASKPLTPIRTFAATVPPRRPGGRPGPIAPLRRPTTVPTPPRSPVPLPPVAAPPVVVTPAAEVQPPAASPVPPRAEPASMPPESLRTVAEKCDAAGLEQVFANLVGDQSAQPVAQVQDDVRDSLVAQPTMETMAPPASSPPAFAITETPAASQPEPIAMENAPVEELPPLNLAVELTPSAQIAATAKPAASKSAASVNRRPARFSPLVLFVVVPLATLLSLGGIAVLTMSQITPMPTASVELEKLDFHLQMLMQTFLGGTLLLAGLLMFVVAALVQVSRAIRLQSAK